MSIEGQGHFFTIYFPGFVCFVLFLAKISGERLQDHWSSGYFCIECTSIDRTCQLYHHQVKIMFIYEGTNNLVSGAFLKFFSIYRI